MCLGYSCALRQIQLENRPVGLAERTPSRLGPVSRTPRLVSQLPKSQPVGAQVVYSPKVVYSEGSRHYASNRKPPTMNDTPPTTVLTVMEADPTDGPDLVERAQGACREPDEGGIGA
jgi:hypothetical protein